LVIYAFAAVVSVYALSRRALELRRKYRKATVHSIQPDEQPPLSKSVARERIKELVTEAAAHVTGLDAATALETFQSEFMEGFTADSVEHNVHDLEAELVDLRESVEQKRITVLVLCFEDLPFMAVNLWMMSVNPSQISR
jgi:hypothetical protein